MASETRHFRILSFSGKDINALAQAKTDNYKYAFS